MWFVYLLQCKNDVLYTGVTNNLPQRIAAHNDGTGGAFTRAMRPCKEVWHEHHPDRSAAQKREAQIKKLPRTKKLLLVKKDAR